MDFFEAQDAPGHEAERAGSGALILADEPAASRAEVEVLIVKGEWLFADGARLAENDSAKEVLRVIARFPDAFAGSHVNLLFGS